MARNQQIIANAYVLKCTMLKIFIFVRLLLILCKYMNLVIYPWEFVMIQFRFLCLAMCLSQILLVPQMAAVIILEFASSFACLYLVDYSPVPVLLAFN